MTGFSKPCPNCFAMIPNACRICPECKTRIVFYRPVYKPVPGVHPMVARLFAEMTKQQCSIEELASKSGCHPQTIKKWRFATAPSLANLQACLNVLGFEIYLKEDKSIR